MKRAAIVALVGSVAAGLIFTAAAAMGELRAATSDVFDARRALGDLVLGEPPDEAAIRAASTRLGEAIGSASVPTARLAGEVRPILTPEQREPLREMRDRRERRLAERLEGRRQRGGSGDLE